MTGIADASVALGWIIEESESGAERASLITADHAFVAAAARHGVYAWVVKLLGN